MNSWKLVSWFQFENAKKVSTLFRIRFERKISDAFSKYQLRYVYDKVQNIFSNTYCVQFQADYSYSDVDYMETWRGMEDVQRLGLAKSIGVSNFNKEQLQRVLNESSVKPVALQIEVYYYREDFSFQSYNPFLPVCSPLRTSCWAFLDFCCLDHEYIQGLLSRLSKMFRLNVTVCDLPRIQSARKSVLCDPQVFVLGVFVSAIWMFVKYHAK